MFEIGNTLREARLRRGLEISECEQETKIRAKYLRAMEEEQFELMPTSTYVRGFLRTYADFLDLDGQLVLDEYESRSGELDRGTDPGGRSRTGRTGRTGRERGRGGGRGPYGGDDRVARGTAPRPRREPAPRRTETQLLWLAIGGVMAVALLVWLGVGGDSSDPPIPPASPSVPGAAAELGPSGARASEDAPAPAAPADPRRVAITLTATGDIGSHLIVNGGTHGGPEVYNGLLPPGESITVPNVRAIWMRVGNPAGLVVSVGGEEHLLEGGTGTFAVTRDGPRRLEG